MWYEITGLGLGGNQRGGKTRPQVTLFWQDLMSPLVETNAVRPGSGVLGQQVRDLPPREVRWDKTVPVVLLVGKQDTTRDCASSSMGAYEEEARCVWRSREGAGSATCCCQQHLKERRGDEISEHEGLPHDRRTYEEERRHCVPARPPRPVAHRFIRDPCDAHSTHKCGGGRSEPIQIVVRLLARGALRIAAMQPRGSVQDI